MRDKQSQLDRLVKLQKDRVVSESELDVVRFARHAAQMEQKAAEVALGQRRARSSWHG